MKYSVKANAEQDPARSLSSKWVHYIQDDCHRMAVPVGPRFQAKLPDWRAQLNQKNLKDCDTDTLKYIGIQIWPLKGKCQATEKGRMEKNMNVIGKGRPEFCPCEFRGSVECIKRHVAEKRFKLQYELGPAFWIWKFNEMGEDVSKLWTLQEQKKFEFIVKMNPTSQGKSFMKPVFESLPSQSRKSIVNHYLNVYLPRRISIQTRSGYRNVDTDDEGAAEASESRRSRKKCKSDSLTSDNSKVVKTRYLTGIGRSYGCRVHRLS